MLAVLGLLEPLPIAILSPYLGFVSLATGTVMAVVQATVQSESGGKLLGTATSGVSLCRALGAAIGTALAGSLLFATLAASGMEISTDLQAMLQGSGRGAGEPRRREARPRSATMSPSPSAASSC